VVVKEAEVVKYFEAYNRRCHGKRYQVNPSYLESWRKSQLRVTEKEFNLHPRYNIMCEIRAVQKSRGRGKIEAISRKGHKAKGSVTYSK
jgi:hypothetical protein